MCAAPHQFARRSPPRLRDAAHRAALGIVLAAPLAACATSDRIHASSIPADDYHVRHPIVLANDTATIDLFPAPSADGLDGSSFKRVQTLAEEYRSGGHGPVLVLLPSTGRSGEPRGVLAGVKRAFAAAGTHPGFTVSTYPVGNPALASPVRLSFLTLKAKVGDQCGQWPSDLASGATIDGWSNRPYYNFGCATQSMIAAQTADPRDLVTPRGEGPADTLIQNRAIEQIRAGADPATSWTVHNTSIGSVGGN